MFSDLKNAISAQFAFMKQFPLYYGELDTNALWKTYLGAFPAWSNPIYKERTEHDCNCCKSFIRQAGNIVAIVPGGGDVYYKRVSIWDIEVAEPYQSVVDALSATVHTLPITNIFLSTERSAGTAKSFQALLSGATTAWEHFHVEFPAACVKRGDQIGPLQADARATKDVLLRGLQEISIDALNTVLELIDQNSLYRGVENRSAVDAFRRLKRHTWIPVHQASQQELFAWVQSRTVASSVSRIRNTSIGTLLVDLSEGKDLDQAVASFESKVAPTNYKRPTALVTKAQIQKTQTTIDELGLTSALERRYATIDDITVNNILHANRLTKRAVNVFDDLAAAAPENMSKLSKVEEVSIEDFISKILPKAESLEVLFENGHAGNLVSLIAPVDPGAKLLFKWPNAFSWSYAGEVADSIKERVKAAGGNVTGDLRCSLAWFNYDDLDLHMLEPGGDEIYYGGKFSSRTQGCLDVDMNAGAVAQSRSAVENITYPSRTSMTEGTYKLFVHNFNKRETKDVGFEVEIEFDGVVHTFSNPTAVRDGDRIPVADITYSRKTGFSITSAMTSKQTSKTVWGLATQTFQKVNVFMLSPNHWDDQVVGNKHYFFMLDGARNEDKARGFFNEFLTQDLNEHRKVLELVGSKMKTDESANQLSGLGFSSTQRNSLIARVKGAFTRTLKITF